MPIRRKFAFGDGFKRRRCTVVDEDQLRNEGRPVQGTCGIKVRDVAHDQVWAIEGDGVSLVDQAAKILVMTDQFPKH